MKHAHFRLILASVGLVGLALMILGSPPASADDNATGETKATTAPPTVSTTDDATPAPAAADATKPGEAKPGRLRFRSAKSAGCTPATGGVSEADIHRAEEGRTDAKN